MMGYLCILLFAICFSDLLLAAVVDYDVTYITTSELANKSPTHWAQYDNNVVSHGKPSLVSRYDDSPTFEDIGIASSFYFQNVSWYVSSNGFLSPTPSPMCPFFCTETSRSGLYGNYQFSTSNAEIYGGGGNWPMIGLYVTDMDPSATLTPSILYLNSRDRSACTVEFSEVPTYFSESGLLTSQVTIYTNGTVIFRYKKLPLFSSTYTTRAPSVGLIFSQSFRKIATTPTARNGIVAIRFDPVLDNCEVHSAAPACTSSGTKCTWCSATNTCMQKGKHVDRCPTTSLLPAEISATTQSFYSVRITQGGGFTDLTKIEGVATMSPNGPYMGFSLHFTFPFFDAESSTGGVSSIHLLEPGTISVTSRLQECNPLWNTCPNGNYSFAILPYQTAGYWTFTTLMVFARLPERGNGEVLCEEESCPPAFVLQLLDAARGNPGWRALDMYAVSYQVLLDAKGRVEFVYDNSRGEEFYAFPAPEVGLFRHGREDPSTVRVPPGLITRGTVVRFTPISNCSDCGLHGWCNEDTKLCSCKDGFTGTQCNQCIAGFYGRLCLPCRFCENGGACDDGINGSGECICNSPFGGEKCEVNCTGPSACADCNLHGGYCLCGQCICRTGWVGPNCRKAEDPCLRYSLDGCPVCTSHREHKCSFCYDNICYSEELSGTRIGYSCSKSIAAADTELCAPVVYQNQTGINLDWLSIMTMVLVVVALIALIGLLIAVARRKRRIVDAHVALATGGAPNLSMGRREREVIQVGFIDKRMVYTGEKVMGIPLKQLSLQKLYAKQNGIEKKKVS